jgi:hypothetical protein
MPDLGSLRCPAVPCDDACHLSSSQLLDLDCGRDMLYPQDDVLPGTLTVYEYLLFNAALKLPVAPGEGAGGPTHVQQVGVC